VPAPSHDTAHALRALLNEPWPDDPDTSHDDRPAAVLVLLADGPRGAEVLLTRRPWHMRTHKGEVTFPGGKLDPGETYEQAALREAWEEVGLPPETVTVVGRLHPVRPLMNNNWIMPVLAYIPAPVELVGHAAEVDRVWWVPLGHRLRRAPHLVLRPRRRDPVGAQRPHSDVAAGGGVRRSRSHTTPDHRADALIRGYGPPHSRTAP
jgi:8-oxo-dGTP pyrophosphatase MutT (NUDIX family)